MLAYKVVMVGDFAVGKTSLVRRFVDNSFSEDYHSSIGVTIARKLLFEGDKKSNVMLWDIEGKTEFKPIFKQYLSGAKGFIVVADLTRKRTIDSLVEHISLCEEIMPNAPICVALNKNDTENHAIFCLDTIKAISSNIIAVMTTSAKESACVEEIFHKLNQTILLEINNV